MLNQSVLAGMVSAATLPDELHPFGTTIHIHAHDHDHQHDHSDHNMSSTETGSTQNGHNHEHSHEHGVPAPISIALTPLPELDFHSPALPPDAVYDKAEIHRTFAPPVPPPNLT